MIVYKDERENWLNSTESKIEKALTDEIKRTEKEIINSLNANSNSKKSLLGIHLGDSGYKHRNKLQNKIDKLNELRGLFQKSKNIRNNNINNIKLDVEARDKIDKLDCLTLGESEEILKVSQNEIYHKTEEYKKTENKIVEEIKNKLKNFPEAGALKIKFYNKENDSSRFESISDIMIDYIENNEKIIDEKLPISVLSNHVSKKTESYNRIKKNVMEKVSYTLDTMKNSELRKVSIISNKQMISDLYYSNKYDRTESFKISQVKEDVKRLQSSYKLLEQYSKKRNDRYHNSKNNIDEVNINYLDNYMNSISDLNERAHDDIISNSKFKPVEMKQRELEEQYIIQEKIDNDLNIEEDQIKRL